MSSHSLDMRGRWERVWDGMAEAGVDTLVVAGRASIGEYGALHYLTGRYPLPQVGFAVVRLGEAPRMLLRSPMEARAFELESDEPVDAIQIDVNEGDYQSAVGQFLAELNVDSVGMVRGDLMNAFAFAELTRVANARLRDCTPIFERIRSGKTKEDLRELRNAAAIAEEGLRHAIRQVRPAQSEEEIAAGIEAVVRSQGAKLIMVFVSKDAFFGQRPTSRRVTASDTLSVLVEMCGRTGHWVELGIALAMPEATGSAAARVCIDALRKGAGLLSPGTPYSDIAKAIETPISEAGFDTCINLGHCVGVDEERPSIHRRSTQVVPESAAIALHPSAAKPVGYEGAIVANTYLLMPEGIERLSSMPEILHEASKVG
jgi:Xaa-Pro aminopeptidase